MMYRTTHTQCSMIIHILKLLITINLFFLNGTYCFSACDEIDIAFVVDTDSILANSDAVIAFITNIIRSGSSEHTGFSVVLYGHNIPIDQNIKVISLHDTKDATQREAAEKAVENTLRKAFDRIQSVVSVGSPAPINANNAAAKRQYIESFFKPDDDEHDDDDDNDDDDNTEDNNDDTHDQDKKSRDSARTDSRSELKSREDTSSNDDVDEKGNTEKGRVLSGSVGQTKSIDLVAAFKIATGQSRPSHKGNRKLKLGYDPNDKSVIGDHDDQQVYIVFDHNNKLLRSGNDVDICALFHHLDNNQVQNDDEAPYFILGQKYQKADIEQIFCNGAMPSYIKKDTFYRFTSTFASTPEQMERIYCVTCPAEIKSREYNGKINVGNHVQYIDLKTVIKCSLYYYDDDGDEDTPTRLDASKSYVLVKDFVNDDNTFKVEDKLIATQSVRRELKKLDCNADVYHVTKIVKANDELYNTKDEDDTNDYEILKLYVKLPGNPMEYIQNANVHGTVKNHRFRKDYNKKQKYSEYDEYSKAKYSEYDDNIYEYKDDFDDYTYDMDDVDVDDDDAIAYDEVQILRGEMDHLIENEYSILTQITENILKGRAHRMKRVAHKLVKFRKIKSKLIDKFPKHKRYIKSATFAAKLMEENKGMGPFGISLADLLMGRIKAWGEIPLLNLGYKKEWTLTKTMNYDVQVTDKWGLPTSLPGRMEVSTWGDGQLVVRFGYVFKFIIGIRFKFMWQIWTPIVEITFVTFIEWDVGAFFYVQSNGLATMRFDEVLHFERDVRFSIGPVPVLLTPYISINAEIVTTPKEWFHGGISCRYNERLELGFRFCTIPICKCGPIKKKITKHKGCKKKLGIYRHIRERDYGEEMQCPKPGLQQGFDLKINVKIGVILYSIVNIYLRMEFIIPFRVHYPILKATDCKLPSGQDMCQVTKKTQYLKAEFWMSMDLNIYIGILVDFGNIVAMVLGIFGVPMPPAGEPQFEIKIIGPIHLIPRMSLGCLDMKGAILELDTSLRHSCCGRNHYLQVKPAHPYYDKQYMDHYETQYSDGTQNPYYDHPFYEDKGFNNPQHFNIHDPYHYNDDHEYSTDYYSPAYHFPIEMRPIMKRFKREHAKEKEKHKQN